MTIGPEERERQLRKLQDGLRERFNQYERDAKSKFKDYLEKEFTSAINDAEAARSRNDPLMESYYQMKASYFDSILKTFES